MESIKVCCHCKLIKPITAFHKNSRAKDGLAFYCKACSLKINQKWRRANPEKLKVIRRRYFQKYKLTKGYRKSQISKRPYQRVWMRKRRATLKKLVLEKFGGKCARCGFSDERAIDIDHVFNDGSMGDRKLSRPKFYKKVLADTEGRYQLLCRNCNRIKEVERLGRHNGRRILRNS